jgi:hypothetical protein
MRHHLIVRRVVVTFSFGTRSFGTRSFGTRSFGTRSFVGGAALLRGEGLSKRMDVLRWPILATVTRGIVIGVKVGIVDTRDQNPGILGQPADRSCDHARITG